MAVNVVAQVFVQFLSIWFPTRNWRAKLEQQRAPISIFIFSSFPEKEKKQTTGEGGKKKESSKSLVAGVTQVRSIWASNNLPRPWPK